MSSQPDQSDEAEVAFADILGLVIGIMLLRDQGMRQGLDDALSYLRDGYEAKGMQKAVALTEYVRGRALSPNIDPALSTLIDLLKEQDQR